MKSFSVLQFVRPKSSGVEFDRLSANPSLTATKKKAPPNLELSGLRLFCASVPRPVLETTLISFSQSQGRAQ